MAVNHIIKSKITLLFSFILLSSLIIYIKGDIPAHCKSSDIIGEWEVQISKDFFKPDLKNDKTTCGHGMPNTVRKDNPDNSIENSYKVKINFKENDNNVYMENEKIGYFTFVYDEGIILYIKNPLDLSKKAEFFFHFRYFFKADTPTSDCNRTLKGWFIKDTIDHMNNWSCAYAHKTSVSAIDNNYSPLKQSRSENFLVASFAQLNEKKTDNSFKIYNLNPEHNYEQTNEFVSHLNNNNNGLWKAGINQSFIGLKMKELYKKFHNNLRSKTSIDEFLQLKSIKPEVPESHNLSFLQIKNKNSNKLKTNNKISLNNSITSQTNEGLKNNKYIIEDTTIQKEKDSSEETDYKVISKYLNSELKDIDIQKLPRNWDWTNVGGVNYTPKVKNQGDCGSCYIMASVSGLETRLRVKTNNQDKTKLSENYFINKSFYTEGCEGGYPILLGKFGSEFGVATEECTSSYEGRQDPNMPVCDSSSEKRKYFVGKYGYLGGYYGNTNEVEMIKELRARGPIMGNIKVPSALMYYQSGIFNDNYHGGPNSGKWSLETMNDRGDLVEVVEHSTLIVGYGEENGYKYWKIMNSWGSDWGEKGFFKVLRGENLIAVETMGDYLDITFKDTN